MCIVWPDQFVRRGLQHTRRSFDRVPRGSAFLGVPCNPVDSSSIVCHIPKRASLTGVPHASILLVRE
jgi:hypothetical protein